MNNHNIYLDNFKGRPRNTNLCLFLQEKFAGVDIRVRVSGGGHVAQIYAIRQAISKALVAFYQKCKHCIKLNFARPVKIFAFEKLSFLQIMY